MALESLQLYTLSAVTEAMHRAPARTPRSPASTANVPDDELKSHVTSQIGAMDGVASLKSIELCSHSRWPNPKPSIDPIAHFLARFLRGFLAPAAR